MGDNGKSQSLLHGRRNSKAQGYSTFDPGGSIDSGLSFSTDDRDARADGITGNATVIDHARERVSISWEHIDVFVEQPGPSCWKRLCFGTEENALPKSKQVLFNGRWYIFRIALELCLQKTRKQKMARRQHNVWRSLIPSATNRKESVTMIRTKDYGVRFTIFLRWSSSNFSTRLLHANINRNQTLFFFLAFLTIWLPKEPNTVLNWTSF